MGAKSKKRDPLETELSEVIAELGRSEEPVVGSTDGGQQKRAIRLLPLVMILVLVLAVPCGLLVGPVRRGEVWTLFREVIQPQPPDFEPLEARDGIALLIRTEGDRSEVIVQLAGYTGWRNVSGSDSTAKSPSLSPTGDQVAYLSEIDEVHIEVVSLITDSRQLVMANIVDTSLSAIQPAGSSICTWSPVRWSPDEDQLAFFVCTQDPMISYAATADLSTDPPRIVWLEEEGVLEIERTLIWLDSSHLLVSRPVLGSEEMTIETVEVAP